MRKRFGTTAVAILLLAVPALPQGAQTPEAMLGAALHQERVTGNLQAAIEAYRKVLALNGVSRPVAAQAQYHIGLCYEKLGNRQARRAYEAVLRSYGDQKDIAGQARAKLAAMSDAPAGVRTRLAWDNATDLWGSVGGNGRYFSFVEWSSCDLGLRDLLTGENLTLTNIGGCRKAQAEVEASAVSPDGKRVVFEFRRFGGPAGAKDGRADIRIIDIDGKNERILLKGGLDYAEPYSWSPDGKWIAAALLYGQKVPKDHRIGLISAETGQVRHFPPREGEWPRQIVFSPDGKWLAYSYEQKGARPKLLTVSLEGGAETLVQENASLMGWPREGGILFTRERGGTNDLYMVPVQNGRASGEPAPIYSSSDVGKMPAGITSQGALFFKSSNRRAETLVLPWTGSMRMDSPTAFVPTTNGIGWLLGSGAAHFSSDGRRLFAIAPSQAITIREMDTGAERTIQPQLTTWEKTKWSHDGASLLVMGAAPAGKYGVYRVEDSTGKATLLAEVPPETWSFAPSRDGKVIYHGTPKQTRARDLASGADKIIFEAPEGGNYDLRVSHDGKRLAIRGGRYLAVADLESGANKVIYWAPQITSIALWAMDWTADDKHLVAIVRPAGGIEKMELWTFSPEGGEPVRQPNPKDLRGLSFTPDGKFVATTNMTQRWQLWVLENFLPAKR